MEGGGGVFIFILVLFSIFGGVFNKTIITLVLLAYEMIMTNSVIRVSFTIHVSIISFPTSARGIILNISSTV